MGEEVEYSLVFTLAGWLNEIEGRCGYLDGIHVGTRLGRIACQGADADCLGFGNVFHLVRHCVCSSERCRIVFCTEKRLR